MEGKLDVLVMRLDILSILVRILELSVMVVQ
jgi:hypothetical protein